MKTILLPTDFSENSWNAVVFALNFYENTTCTFYLLHVNRLSNAVINDSPYIATKRVMDDVYIKSAKKQLGEFINRIKTQVSKNKKHKFYSLTDNNSFIESIRKHVDQKKVDAIVMGTKGASGIKKFIVGSNTGDVITKVKCTTLVVPENARFSGLGEVAFPTDFSLYHGVEALGSISEILEAYNSTLRILHISKKEAKLNVEQQRNKELLEDYFTNQNPSFHFLINKKIEGAVQGFVKDRAIDLITMVAKNLNYFQQILFHSKVEEISYHTDIPFLVVHD